MRKFVATILLLFVFTSSGFSQVVIKKENRVLNRSPGYCAWTCLETLGRHHQIKKLYNLLDNRSKEFTWVWDEEKQKWVKSPYVLVEYGQYRAYEHRAPASHAAIVQKLNTLKVKYRYQDYWNYDKTMLINSVKSKQGCIVVVKWWLDKKGRPANDSSDTHAIVLLDYNKDGIEFFDPNDIKCTYTATHEWFNMYWTGYTLIVE